MMKIEAISMSFLFEIQTFSPMRINTISTGPSAILDINHSNKDLLIPEVSLKNNIDLTTLSNPTKGLLVYNLTSSAMLDNKAIADSFYAFYVTLNS